MIYEKNRIKRIIEYKDTLLDEQKREDIEWLIERYNDYFADSKEYERKRSEYSKVLNNYYSSEEEKVLLKELIIKLRRKNKLLKYKVGGNK